MDWLYYALAVVAVLGLVAAATWKPIRSAGREVQAARARESYTLMREQLEAKFLTAADATGKPRGLRWVDVALERELTLARERATGQLVGLAAASIKFEAIEGGDMEGVAAVSNIRVASAVFTFVKGRWTTSGRAIFNMDPDEAIRHFAQQYEAVRT